MGWGRGGESRRYTLVSLFGHLLRRFVNHNVIHTYYIICFYIIVIIIYYNLYTTYPLYQFSMRIHKLFINQFHLAEVT